MEEDIRKLPDDVDPVIQGPQHLDDEVSPQDHLKMNSVLTASQSSLLCLGADPNLNRVKLENGLSHSSLEHLGYSVEPSIEEPPGHLVDKRADSHGVVSPEQHLQVKENMTSASTAAPLKATKFSHLRQKYLPELEYMLTEFKKLERQLQGAKAASRESAGSRERREKLHSFINHLEDTIQQIHTGCQLEAEGKSTVQELESEGKTGDLQDPLEDSALIQLTQEKREEENVQKLEEHILANLLPVKVRLKKQLGAQQGAKHNPAGMPVRGTMALSQRENGKGTFAAAAEERRKSMDLSSSSQFGKPLSGGGSSLTQKLHGSTLGSTGRVHGHGVGTEQAEKEHKIVFAGMAIGSEQMESSVNAANSAHDMVIQDPSFFDMGKKAASLELGDSSLASLDQNEKLGTNQGQTGDESFLDDDQIKRLKRRKRKMKKLEDPKSVREQEVKKPAPAKRKKNAAGSKKRGPWGVEYMCALCNEVYSSTCDYNPWWALTQHDCPKCRKTQIPRIDISAPANAIDYHPALLANADETGGGGQGSGTPMHVSPPHVKPPSSFPATTVEKESDESEGSDLSDEDWEGILSDDNSLGSDQSDTDVLASLTPSEQAEIERFGAEYTGPRLTDHDSGRLLSIMAHASTCPCQHKSAKHRDVCRSTKYMMLHIRDCPGTTTSFDVCPFPWCRKVKHLLYHLVSCQKPKACSICTPKTLTRNLTKLNKLNYHRLKTYRERMIARFKNLSSDRPTAPETVKSCRPCVATTSYQPSGTTKTRHPGPNKNVQPRDFAISAKAAERKPSEGTKENSAGVGKEQKLFASGGNHSTLARETEAPVSMTNGKNAPTIGILGKLESSEVTVNSAPPSELSLSALDSPEFVASELLQEGMSSARNGDAGNIQEAAKADGSRSVLA